MKGLSKERIKINQGFTMMELIIVISIMGILSAILVPSFTHMTRKSRFNADLNTIKHVQMQIELYMAEHDGEFPGRKSNETHSADEFKNVIKALVDDGYLKSTDTIDNNGTLDLQSSEDNVTATYTVSRSDASGNPERENATLTVTGGRLDTIANKINKRDRRWVIATK